MSKHDGKTSMRKITVNLPQDTIDILKQLAEVQGITATAALRQAISTENFLWHEVKENQSKVFIQDGKGETKQIVFR